jgi:hypothetical protein
MLNVNVFSSNFSDFQSDFTKDTGLDAKKNMDQYLVYYQGRMLSAQAKSLRVLADVHSAIHAIYLQSKK